MTEEELMALAPQGLCDAYHTQLARLYGPERAKASRVDYSNGWYYIAIAAKYSDGSVGLGGRQADAHRKQAVVQRVLVLQGRKE